MNKIKNIALVGAVVGVLVLAVFGGGTNTITKETVREVSKNLGALVGPDIPYQYITVGGLRTIRYGVGLNKGSTTLCSIQPAATSTLRFASLRVDADATTSAMEYTIAKASLANTNSTTTAFHITSEEGVSVAANVPVTLLASTTVTEGGNTDRLVFGTADRLVFKYAHPPLGAYVDSASYNTLTGQCSAEFIAN